MTSGEYRAAPLDTTARVVTILVLIMAGVFPFIPEMPVYGALLLPLIFFTTWLFSVRCYTIRVETLLIHRPMWTTEIKLPPDSVFRFEPEIKKGLWRTAGNGGLFGYTGRFRNRDLGNFRAFATNWNTAVSITSESTGYKLVITPESPEVVQPSEEVL